MKLVGGCFWLGLLLLVTGCPEKEVRKDGAPEEAWSTERTYECGTKTLMPSGQNMTPGFVHVSVLKTCSKEPSIEVHETSDAKAAPPLETYPLPGTKGGAGGVTFPYDPKRKLFLNCPGGELYSFCQASLSVHHAMTHTPNLSTEKYVGKTEIPCGEKKQIWRNYSNRTLDYQIVVRNTCGADPIVRLINTKNPQLPVEEFNARTGKPVYGMTNGHSVEVLCPSGTNGRAGCDVELHIIRVR